MLSLVDICDDISTELQSALSFARAECTLGTDPPTHVTVGYVAL